MNPDLERAAVAACETLIKYRVSTAPVVPMPILKAMRGVLVLSFTEMADRIGFNRADIVDTFDAENRDVVTSVTEVDGRLKYLVAYNQRLPFYMLQRAMARELGHIILGHDGSRPEAVREDEAMCFARHFICPRPLISAVRETGIPLTVEVLGNITGCYERCLIGIRKTPGIHVPAQLNRIIRDQFADYVENFVDCSALITCEDETPLVDFGTYMDGYED